MTEYLDIIKKILTDYRTYIPIYTFMLGIILKVLLDMNLGTKLIKYFYWASPRSIFRKNTNKISGIYKQYWQLKRNARYKKVGDRQSLITLKQFSNYCYGEFTAKNDKYYLYGEIVDKKIIGHWSDVTNKVGYFGSFELSIIDKKNITGFWIGHSNTNPNKINIHQWNFICINDSSKFLVLIQLKILFRNIFRSIKFIWKKHFN